MKRTPDFSKRPRVVGPVTERVGGYSWTGYYLRWTDPRTGRYHRRRFRELDGPGGALVAKAELEVEFLNCEATHRLRQTSLEEAQLREAEDAVARLGVRHTLREAVDYFLARHQAAGEAMTLCGARAAFLDAKEAEGLRPQSLRQLAATLRAFFAWLDPGRVEGEPAGNLRTVESVTPGDVQGWLAGLRNRRGDGPAVPKTRNNYRADLRC